MNSDCSFLPTEIIATVEACLQFKGKTVWAIQRKLSGNTSNELILSSCLSLPFCSDLTKAVGREQWVCLVEKQGKVLLKRQKALRGGKGDFKAQGKIVRLGAVVPNLNAVFSQGRLVWLTGSARALCPGH